MMGVCGAVVILLVLVLSGVTTQPLEEEEGVLELEEHLSQLTTDTMIIPGDVYIADLSHQHDWTSSRLCGQGMSPKTYGGVQFSMAGVYGIEKVNADQSILPNITLGLVMLDICRKGPPAVGQTLKLVPRHDQAEAACQLTSGNARYDVVGVLGPLSSSSTLAVSSLLGFFQLPHVSPTATSPVLSDRSKYGHFFRTVPPDSMQAGVMVDVAAGFNWTYIAVLYEQSAFGYGGLTLTRKHARETGVCVSAAYPLSADYTAADYERTVGRMVRDRRARAVIVFVGSHHSLIYSFLTAARKLSVNHHFIFLFPDSISRFVLSGFEEVTLGSFLINFYTGSNPEFDHFINHLHPQLYPNNPWLGYLWEEVGGCKMEDVMRSGSDCSELLLGDMPGFTYYSSTPTMIQAVEIMGVAIHRLIQDHCPGASRDKSLLSSCFSPGLLIDYLRTSTLDTESGPRGFDQYGALLQDYEVRQLMRGADGGAGAGAGAGAGYQAPIVGIWGGGSVSLSWDKLRWYQDNNNDIDGSRSVPESQCGKPCHPGEFRIPGELICCWECRPCRSNEVVSDNATRCQPCPPLTWPHQTTYLTCLPVHPSYLSWDDEYGISLTVLVSLGLGVTLYIALTIVTHRERKVIRGSSVHLMAVILLGLLAIFLSVLLFIARPTRSLCLVSHLGFSLSCTIIFSSLLVKTNRVYQVFRASSRFTRVGPTARSSVSLSLVLLLVAIQVILQAACFVVWPVTAVEKMPSLTLPYVERYCEQDRLGLLLPLSYNLVILLVCCIFAFLTRRLPDNYNEGWYILLCVSTTLFVWLAFLPTYFSAFYASHRVALLGLALVLNAFITILALFITKLYALYFINDKDIKVTDFETQNFEQPPTAQR